MKIYNFMICSVRKLLFLAKDSVEILDSSNVCDHKVDPGTCNGDFKRYAFDSVSGECKPFRYGGCGGNGNNFATESDCKKRCKKHGKFYFYGENWSNLLSLVFYHFIKKIII